MNLIKFDDILILGPVIVSGLVGEQKYIKETKIERADF